ncbi:MAG: GTPase [Candidatus Woesearchaeota archaeon]
MSFQDIKKIENKDFYLNQAFKKAKLLSITLKRSLKIKEPIKKTKEIEIQKLDFIRAYLKEEFKNIITQFPNFDSLDDFYKELVKLTMDYVYLKKSLASLNWANEKFDFFFNLYKNKIKKDSDFLIIKKHSREYYGRISSILRQIEKHLLYLEEIRKTLKEFPVIKTSLFTICLFGFPNVGKSTLLSKLTTSKPEINDYPFTTKSLNLGYIKENARTIQVIDTPGTLNRLEKMNNIELQAYLALKHVANLIVFVFDPSDEFEKQEKLLETIKKFQKDIIIYVSKTDLLEQKENPYEIDLRDNLNLLKNKYKKEIVFTNLEELKDYIKKESIKKENIKEKRTELINKILK